jgi:hypothetical protein
MNAEQIAQVCHTANRELQIIQADPTIPVSELWEVLDEETKRSAIDGVQFHLDNPDVTPEDSHNNWCEFKEENGWTYGPIKDETKKEHPLLVEYSELPESQQIKGSLFAAIVKALGE